MFDIYFDLNNMHQVVEMSDANDDYDGDIFYSSSGENLSFDFVLDLPEVKKAKSEGCICIKCNEFNPYAEPNQQDGTFKCYSCRTF